MSPARFLPLLLLGLVAGNAVAQSSFPLGTRRTYPIGATPQATAVGDFNRDGNPDVAVALMDRDSVAVRLGDGKGTFGAVARYKAGGHVAGLAVGDLNGDGFAEIVTANHTANTVSVFLGRALGAFDPKLDHPVGMLAIGVAIGDVTGDSRPDVVAACVNSNSVTVLVGSGIGPGLTGTSFSVPTAPGATFPAIADLDGDGLNDVVVANQNSTSMSVLKGLPNGSLAPKVDYLVGEGQVMVALGDLDGDGAIDAAAANIGVSEVSILRGDGLGNFGPHEDFVSGLSPNSIVMADVTGDAIPDLVTGNSGEASVTVLANDGSGFFTASNIPTNETASKGVSVADFDGDGRRDLLFSSFNNVMLMSGNGGGVFGEPTSFAAGSSPQALALGDLNGDSYPDVVTGNYSGSNASVLLNAGDGSFPAHVEYPTTAYPTAVAIGDLGVDGNREIVVGTGSPSGVDMNRIVVLPNLGSGTFGPKVEFGVAAERHYGLVLGELNGDGKLDLVVSQSTTGALQPYFGDGLGGFAIQTALTTGQTPNMVKLVDLNGNGTLDLLVTEQGGGGFSIFQGNGLGSFPSHVGYGSGMFPIAFDTGDLDGDGDVDIAVSNRIGATISIHLNNGSGFFSPGTSVTSPEGQPGWNVLGDVNQDGILDLVYPIGIGLVTRLGLVGAKFTPRILQPVASEPLAIALADIDKNGTLDAVTANSGSNDISVLFGLARTRTALAVSPPTSPVNSSLTLTATVTPASPDSSDPTGTVRFFDGFTLLGTAPISNHVAALTLPATRTWERSFRAEYLGNDRLYGSLSPGVPHVTFQPTVGVEPPPGASFALALALARNPVIDGRLRVRVALASAEPAELSLVDVRGRVVVRLAASAGEQALALGRELAPGVYHVRLVQGAAVAVARAVVL